MDAKIDYLAFTVATPSPTGEKGEQILLYFETIMDTILGGAWEPITRGHRWQFYDHRGFYHTRVFNEEMKLSVFWGDTNAHFYVECGGQTCDYLRDHDIFDQIAECVDIRVSRVDFAVDFETDVQPEDFVINNQRKSFKGGGNIFSKDGKTSYVGTWKGKRFARVYRYHEPHPRAHLLRAEVVLKGEYAKQGIALYLEKGLEAAVLAAHHPFDWRHELWQPPVLEVSRIKARSTDKTAASTLRWLIQSVAPALARAHREDWINLDDWIETTVKPLISE